MVVANTDNSSYNFGMGNTQNRERNNNMEHEIDLDTLSLWDVVKDMLKKYPNEKLWNTMAGKTMRFETLMSNMRQTLKYVMDDAQRDLDNLDEGYQPSSLSLNSYADRLVEQRQEMKTLTDDFKTLLYIADIDEADDKLFWLVVKATVANGGRRNKNSIAK